MIRYIYLYNLIYILSILSYIYIENISNQWAHGLLFCLQGRSQAGFQASPPGRHGVQQEGTAKGCYAAGLREIGMVRVDKA